MCEDVQLFYGVQASRLYKFKYFEMKYCHINVVFISNKLSLLVLLTFIFETYEKLFQQTVKKRTSTSVLTDFIIII